MSKNNMSKKNNLRSIFRYAAPFKKSFIFGTILSLAGAGLKLLAPLNIGKIMNYLQENIDGVYDFGVVKYYAFWAGLFITLGFIFQSLQSVVLSSASQKLSFMMKKSINEKLDRLPISFFTSRDAGDIQSRLTNDVNSVSLAISNNIASIATALTTLIICLFIMFRTNVILSVVTILNALIGIILTVIVMMKSLPFAQQQAALLGSVNSEVYEAFNGHLVIKSFNCENDVVDHFRATNRDLTENGWKASFYQSITMPLMMFIGNMGYIIIAVTGTILALNHVGNTTLGDILVFIFYAHSVSNPLSTLASSAGALQPAMVAVERVDELMNEPEISDKDDAIQKDTVKGDVVFEHVKFGYVPDKIILNDLNAEIKAGQKVAIVGPTGAGKSTMVNLLMRFYEPQSGRILLDGVPVTDYSEENFRDMLGMVLQDVWTFEGTIRENIVYSSQNVSEERLNNIIVDIGLKHFIETLPDGLNTVLSENSSVSFGQKQLITIGRAMAKNAPVLILDEATSSVDTRTEKLIQSALDKLMEGKTSFVIAHRLSTIKNADKIFVMNAGDVVEIGTHEELLAKNGLYAEIYASQFSDNA